MEKSGILILVVVFVFPKEIQETSLSKGLQIQSPGGEGVHFIWNSLRSRLWYDVYLFNICLSRYFAVCYPIAFRTKFTLRRTKFVIVCLWILSMATASPALIVFKVNFSKVKQIILQLICTFQSTDLAK